MPIACWILSLTTIIDSCFSDTVPLIRKVGRAGGMPQGNFVKLTEPFYVFVCY